MDQDRLRAIEAHCTQEAVPHCRAACPFGLDVRAFMEMLSAGKFVEARKVLERQVPLPGLLARICDHPCENVCLRRDLGGSLGISALEKFCVARFGQQIRPLPRSPKAKKVAVLGSGLAGLVVACSLSRKAWPVTVFYAEEQAGEGCSAWLHRRFPEVEPQVLEAELQSLSQAGVHFEAASLDVPTLTHAQKAFAAVFIDADAAPDLAPQRDKVDAATLELEAGVCCGGWLEISPTGARYASASRQAGDGLVAAMTLERQVSGVSLTAARKERDAGSALFTPVEGLALQEKIVPQAALYTEEEAQAEAGRCIRCECLACVRECVYLQKFRGYPRMYARQVYNNASIVKGLHTANSLINGCALCGQCTELCPEHFSMADLCRSAREDMVDRHFMPPSAHEFALEDMDNALGPECALCVPSPAPALTSAATPAARPALTPTATPAATPAVTPACGQVFFPGCQLGASRGEQVLAVYRHLRQSLRQSEKGVGLWISCCGVPAYWAGQKERFATVLAQLTAQWAGLGKPRVIMACASCLKIFREFLPQIPVISLWEVLDAETLPAPSAKVQGLPPRCTVHDPCAARHDRAWQGAVRSLVRKQGIAVVEARRTAEETACCGYGGLVWNAQPDLADAMAAHRAEALPEPALASCIMCRDRLAATGKACFHVLDFLPLGPSPHHLAATGQERGPTLSGRRAMRAALRHKALQEFGPEWGLDAESAQGLGAAQGIGAAQSGQFGLPLPPVEIAPPVLEALERKHILRQDVEQALRGVEASKGAFLEKESGHLLGAWRPRHVTFWVEYSRTGAGYVIHDSWCHRMIVPGAGTPPVGLPGASPAALAGSRLHIPPMACCVQAKDSKPQGAAPPLVSPQEGEKSR